MHTTIIARRPSYTNLPSPTPNTTPRKARFPVGAGTATLGSTSPTASQDYDGRYDALQLRLFAALLNTGRSADIEQGRLISRVSEIYMQHICAHINRIHGCHLPGQTPLLFATDARFHQFFVEKEYHGINVGNDYITSATRLQGMGITSQNFLSLHHFFIPVIYDGCHAQLLVISPLIRTIQFFCSGEHPYADNREEVYTQACILVESIIGEAFIPSEWLIRRDTGSKQGHTQNCVVYVMMNAMSVAFGYDADFTGKSFRNARYRVACELLNHGFEPHDGDQGSAYYYPYLSMLRDVGDEAWLAYRRQECFVELVDDADVKMFLDEYDPSIWLRESSA